MLNGMIGCKKNSVISFSDLGIEITKERSQIAVKSQVGIFNFNRIRAKLMPDIIRRRNTYCKEIGDSICSQGFIVNSGFCQVQSQ